jgi:chromate transporter
MNSSADLAMEVTTEKPTLGALTKLWAKIGVLSFGGPAAQIALMHKLVVEKMRWMSEKEYLNALSFCMLLPGPEAMQLAAYAGWRSNGVIGGIIAGSLFVIPGAIVIMALAWIYAVYGNVPVIQALFLGVKAAVLIIVVEALLKISKKALKRKDMYILAGLSFISIFFLNIPYPLIVLAAAAYGFFVARGKTPDALAIVEKPKGFGALIKTVFIWLAIWLLPLFVAAYFTDQQILIEIGKFFSKLAVVTFGGAYAVLAYMGQDVVNYWVWLTPEEMMDGFGLAETTPGPLILVTEFVGFLAGYKEAGIGLGIAAALITLWTTFIPCFLWIFAGAPYIEWIGAQPKLKSALQAISAAVVGVILNLSVWFALHVMFDEVKLTSYGPVKLWQPDLASVDWRIVVLVALCAVLLLKLHWGIVRVLTISSLLGAALVYLT